jgi:hypothetical protein
MTAPPLARLRISSSRTPDLLIITEAPEKQKLQNNHAHNMICYNGSVIPEKSFKGLRCM